MNQLLPPSQKPLEFLGGRRVRPQGPKTISAEPDHLGQHEGINGIILPAAGTIDLAGSLGTLGLNSKDGVSLLYQPGLQGPIIRLDAHTDVAVRARVVLNRYGQFLQPGGVVGDLASLKDLTRGGHQEVIMLAPGPIKTDNDH